MSIQLKIVNRFAAELFYPKNIIEIRPLCYRIIPDNFPNYQADEQLICTIDRWLEQNTFYSSLITQIDIDRPYINVTLKSLNPNRILTDREIIEIYVYDVLGLDYSCSIKKVFGGLYFLNICSLTEYTKESIATLREKTERWSKVNHVLKCIIDIYDDTIMFYISEKNDRRLINFKIDN